jgi:lysozyme
MNLTYTASGLAETEQFESCKLTAYQDVKGVWTIGWGHTGNVRAGDTCIQEQADTWLATDIQWAVSVVNNNVTADLNQNEFNALVDFVYNAGSGHFLSSTLLKDLNAGNFNQVAHDLEMWDYCGGQVCAGLLRRRVAEAAEFNS